MNKYLPQSANKSEQIDKKPITSKRRMGKMFNRMLNERGNKYNRIKNKLTDEANHERDLLRRDLNRGHQTTRVARAIRRAVKATKATIPQETK